MKSVLVSALLISIIAGASALECYSCFGAPCGDPFSTSGKATCDSFFGLPAVSCVKAVAGDIVTRSCSSISCPSSTCAGGGCTYCCDSDRCNGGNTVTTSFVAMGVALVAAFIFSRQ